LCNKFVGDELKALLGKYIANPEITDTSVIDHGGRGGVDVYGDWGSDILS
jgi:hypothetical protein